MSPNEFSDQDITDWKAKIDAMSHIEMCRLVRFAPSGHPVFDRTLPLYEYFNERYKALGGMTPKISKTIGW